MNLNKIINITFLIFLAAAQFSYGQDCKAKVYVRTDLPDARIFINQVPSGQGSLNTELAKGKYEVLVTPPGKDWGIGNYRDTIEITGCEKEIGVNYSFLDKRYLDSEPQDAAVSADDTVLGYTPLFIPLGLKKITLNKPSYEKRDVELAGSSLTLPIKLKFIGHEEQVSFFKKPVFKYLMGGIVVLGAATAYLKIKADNNFSDYQRTADKSYLDQTHKYDLLSGITFGALQVNLGFLIYYFLTD